MAFFPVSIPQQKTWQFRKFHNSYVSINFKIKTKQNKKPSHHKQIEEELKIKYENYHNEGIQILKYTMLYISIY